jgi:hypothetical protein
MTKNPKKIKKKPAKTYQNPQKTIKKTLKNIFIDSRLKTAS